MDGTTIFAASCLICVLCSGNCLPHPRKDLRENLSNGRWLREMSKFYKLARGYLQQLSNVSRGLSQTQAEGTNTGTPSRNEKNAYKMSRQMHSRNSRSEGGRENFLRFPSGVPRAPDWDPSGWGGGYGRRK